MNLRLPMESNKSVPVAMMLLVVGLALVSCATGWQHLFAPLAHRSPDLADFAHGFLLGTGLAFEAGAVVLLVMHLRAQRKLP